jgi:hypothetical protein
MDDLSGCQVPCLPQIVEGTYGLEDIPMHNLVRRLLARQWNYSIKKKLKRILKSLDRKKIISTPAGIERGNAEGALARPPIIEEDWVKVRSEEEIRATLDRWNELRGCAFLPEMWQYCGTRQQVLKRMERFLDERDYRVKKTKGIILLKGVICKGTPVFGRCDRCCFFFWREEWLEKVLPDEVVPAVQPAGRV